MRKAKVRFLLWFFGLLFFFQTHSMFSNAIMQNQGNGNNSENKKSFSNYVLEPMQTHIRVAAHRSHSSHSSHSSHRSHSSHQSSSYGISYAVPRTTTYVDPIQVPSPIQEQPEVSTSFVPTGDRVLGSYSFPSDTTSYSFTVPNRLVVHHQENVSDNAVSRAVWTLLAANLEREFQIVPQTEFEAMVQAGIDDSRIVQKHNADFYLTGYIIHTEDLYISSIEFGNAQGKKIKIHKASDSIDLLITSIMNSIRLQVGLF